MHQGQICRIEPNPTLGSDLSSEIIGVSGWFQLLSSEGGDNRYYLIGQKDVSILPASVDDTMANSFPSRPYHIVCVLPTEIQVEATMLTPNIDRLAASSAINGKLNQLKAERTRLCAKRDESEKIYKDSMAAIEQQNEHIRKLEAVIRATLPGAMPEFMYVYAKHTANGQMFCWRVPDDLKRLVFRGSTVIVDTRLGDAHAIVVHIIKLPYLLKHKMVIGVED